MSGYREFGGLIRQLRQEKQKTDPSYSLRQFADKLKLSPTFISKMEKGEFAPPSAENIIKMAELLDYNADELLAMANKFDPELTGIITDNSRAMADFLRTASGLSDEDIKLLTERAKEMKRKEDK